MDCGVGIEVYVVTAGAARGSVVRPLVLGFDVWFCLFVAVCSAVAAVHVCVCVCVLHVLCACYASAMCVGQIHKRG